MRVLRALVGLIVVAIIVLVIAEFGIHLKTRTDARNAAGDVAHAGAHVFFTERDDPKPYEQKARDAQAAAQRAADKDGVTITQWTVDNGNTVHVTVVKEAQSIVIKHLGISGLKRWDQMTVSSTASPS